MIPIETQIFCLIFPPSGSIPLEKLEAVPLIRQHINSIIDLASTEHGISSPDESAALTARVIELRDTPGPDGKIRTWRTIAEICGTTLDAVRHRYNKGKATIRESRNVPLDPETLAEVDRMLGDGIGALDIAAELEKKGKLVPRTKIRARAAYIGRMKGKAQAKPEPKKADEPEPATEQPEEEPQEAEATGDRPEPVAISRKELDLRMWDLHQTGKTPDEISDILFSEGLYYKPKSVRIRLLSQGAKL